MKDPAVFNNDSANYDQMRPSYPRELFTDLTRLTQIPEAGKILEIGCGTGQATIPLLEAGYSLTCLDIGENLIEAVKIKTKKYSNIKFVLSAFEKWEPEPRLYDVVMSATAFHWVDPETGYKKAAEVLKDTGSLALFWNKHPAPYTGFFHDVQSVYSEVVPEWGTPSSAPIDDWIDEEVDRIKASGCFGEVTVSRYPWVVSLKAEEYLRLLDTYSDHGNLEKTRKTRLYTGIADMINMKYGGVVQRPYLSVLFTARKSN